MASTISKRQQARNERALQDLIQTIPGNDQCADCQARNPGWASWNLGVFLCLRCATLHRKLGTHISRVKSLSMDSWSNEQVEVMKRIGNTNSNRLYNPRNTKPPIPIDVDEVNSVMEKYIRQKYERRLLQGGQPRPNTEQHTGSTSSDEPPPLPPKPEHRAGFGLRSVSSTFPLSSRAPTDYVSRTGSSDKWHKFDRGLSPIRSNKQSRVFGATVGEPSENFESALMALKDMGFLDSTMNAKILERHHGNLEKSVETLVAMGEQSAVQRNHAVSEAFSQRSSSANRARSPNAGGIPSSNNPFNRAASHPALRSMVEKPLDLPSGQGPIEIRSSLEDPSATARAYSAGPVYYGHAEDPSRSLQHSFQTLNLSRPQAEYDPGGMPSYQHPQNLYRQAYTPPPSSIPFQGVPASSAFPGHSLNPFLTQVASGPTAGIHLAASPQFYAPPPQEPGYIQSAEVSPYSLQQGFVPQQRSLTPQRTGKVDKSSILALFNYPNMAPLPPSSLSNHMSASVTADSNGATEVEPQVRAAAQRSVSMPDGPLAGSRNPFASGKADNLAQARSGGDPAASMGRHVSQESMDFGSWASGRHSPDAFTSLSARSK